VVDSDLLRPQPRVWKAYDGAELGESESDVRGIVVYLKKYYKMSEIADRK